MRRKKNIQDWFDKAASEQLRGKDTEEGLQEYANEICKYIHPAQGETVLDLVCGDGETTYRVSLSLGAGVVGVDFARAQIARAKEKYPGMTWIVADVLEGLPFPDKEFDYIYSFSFLQYFTPLTYRQMMAEAWRVLKDKGTLVHLSIPDKTHFWKHQKGRLLSRNALDVFLDYFSASFMRRDGSRWWRLSEAANGVEGSFSVEKIQSRECWYRMDLVYRKRQQA